MTSAKGSSFHRSIEMSAGDNMSNFEKIVENYFASWNATDTGQRQILIQQVWADQAVYLEPHMKAMGHEGIGTLIEGVQVRFPGFRFKQLGGVDGHGDRVRFSWELGTEGGDVAAKGTDFAVIDGDGRLAEVTGFLDYVAG
jgi:hypothetical protein